MKCDEAHEALLSEDDSAALRSHLATCSRCAALQAAIGSLRAPPAPSSLSAGVLEALDRRGTFQNASPARRRDPLPWLFRTVAAGAILSYGAIAVWMAALHLQQGTSLPPPPAVESASDARQRAWLREHFGAELSAAPRHDDTLARISKGAFQ